MGEAELHYSEWGMWEILGHMTQGKSPHSKPAAHSYLGAEALSCWPLAPLFSLSWVQGLGPGSLRESGVC
jgi:hypothetical protein